MKLIRFKYPWKKWQSSEVAGFGDEEAARIVGADAGMYVERQQQPPADKQMRPRKSRRISTK